MRTFSATLLSAVAALPALAHATTLLPDPTDPAASVPAVSAPSVFADYQPYQDKKAPSWQELNKSVINGSIKQGMAGMNDGGAPASGAATNHGEHPVGHEGATK
ncbi:hypothetical protein [Burkholderia sp. WSM2230]|uniref:hypothetical protein n=1 Tax=Burkholderia sp. WSM2230 TaxID=944435 RepID=UPI000420C479|nr:hypothetical protein [Burkholderia sp. WSM2230]